MLLSCHVNPEPVFELIDKITSKPTHFAEEDVSIPPQIAHLDRSN